MPITNTALASKVSDLIDSWQLVSDAFDAWLVGTVGGGPNSDGKYPLVDFEGNTTLVKCPAQLADDVANNVTGAAGYASDAADSATAAAASATAAAASATAAADDRAGAETAETAAEAAQADAYSSRAVAIAQAILATTKAAAAAASATAAATSEANAATSESNAADSAGYAAEWANKAHGLLVSSAAGGDLVDDYSALHWATEAATFNPALYALLSGATFSGNVTAPTFTGDGSLLTNVALLNAVNTFTASQNFFQYAGTPIVFLKNTTGGTNEKIWGLGAATATQLGIGTTYTDAGSGVTNGILFTRSGTTITAIALSGTAISLNADTVSQASTVSGHMTLDTTNTNGGYVTFTKSGASRGYIGHGASLGGSMGSTSVGLRSEADLQFLTGGSSTAMTIFSGATIDFAGQGRFKGWYSSGGAGFAAEIGTSGGEAYILAYNRTASTYGTLNFSGDIINIAGHSASAVQAVIKLGGHEAFTDANDGFLRLNNASTYGSGVYTPGNLRADGLLKLGASAYLAPSSLSYGDVYCYGLAAGGFNGFAVYDGSTIGPTLMSNGSNAGIYMQFDSRWMWFANDGGSTMYTQYSTVVDYSSLGAYVRHNSSAYGSGVITVSSSAPSGGSSGDIWFKV